jgi:outer membrane protein OmpA-like peptidoglycan-associated protein
MRAMPPVFLLVSLSSCALLSPASRPDYLVFFSQRSPEINTEAAAIVARAAERAKTLPNAVVTVYGYTDSAGSLSADRLLAQQRAQNVANSLVVDGVAPSRIVRQGRGQTRGDAGVASRRVEIDISA